MLRLTNLFLIISLIGIISLLFFIKFNDEFFEFRGIVNKEVISDNYIKLFLFNNSNSSLILSCYDCKFDSFLKDRNVLVKYRNVSGYFSIERLEVLG